jgi:hypothetical protein
VLGQENILGVKVVMVALYSWVLFIARNNESQLVVLKEYLSHTSVVTEEGSDRMYCNTHGIIIGQCQEFKLIGSEE